MARAWPSFNAATGSLATNACSTATALRRVRGQHGTDALDAERPAGSPSESADRRDDDAVRDVGELVAGDLDHAPAGARQAPDRSPAMRMMVTAPTRSRNRRIASVGQRTVRTRNSYAAESFSMSASLIS